MTSKCICEICTCGQHCCPCLLNCISEKTEKTHLMTEYSENYQAHKNIPPRQSYKPKEEYRRRHIKMEGLTTFRADYIPYDVKEIPTREVVEYRQPDGSMDLDTTYQQDYISNPIYPVSSGRPLEHDCTPLELPKQEAYKPQHTFQPQSAKIDSTTTSQDDYQFRGLVQRESSKPDLDAVKMPVTPFDDLTNYCLDYGPHTIEQGRRHKRVQYQPNELPFDMLTTHRRDYKGLPEEGTKTFKSDFSKVDAGAEFSNMTESHDKYKAWPLPPLYRQQLAAYAPPEGTMDWHTTTHTDFMEYGIQPHVPAHPSDCIKRCSAPFEGQSTMKEDYKQWEHKREPLTKYPDAHDWPAGTFESMTTSQAHYVPHHFSYTESCKPPNHLFCSAVLSDYETTYCSTFTPKEISSCPASYPNPPGYIYEKTDISGHRLYCLLPTMLNQYSTEAEFYK